VETYSAALGKILPSGKFGITACAAADLWNFHPFALTFMDDFLTDWKNNSKYDELRIFGLGLNSKIVLHFGELFRIWKWRE
jgi:hypothetical protein